MLILNVKNFLFNSSAGIPVPENVNRNSKRTADLCEPIKKKEKKSGIGVGIWLLKVTEE